MRLLLIFTIIALITPFALAALPPGYDEEVFCPHQMCLRKKRVRRGFTGPRAMFLECFDPETKQTCRPRVWGVKVETAYKDSLLRDRWHTDKCPEDEERRDRLLQDFLLVGTRLDGIIGKLAALSFM